MGIVIGKTGGRQGCKVGALVFNCIFSLAMTRTTRRMIEVGATISACSYDAPFWDQPSEDQECEEHDVTDATFVDDVCVFAVRRGNTR